MQVSFLLAPSLLSLFSNIKHDQYARPQMLKITCKTSLAKLGVLRAQPIIMNIIKGTTRRDGQDKTARFGF